MKDRRTVGCGCRTVAAVTGVRSDGASCQFMELSLRAKPPVCLQTVYTGRRGGWKNRRLRSIWERKEEEKKEEREGR